MHKRQFSYFLLIIFILVLSGCCPSGFDEVSSASGNNGVVVSSHSIASEIGLNVLKNGGNAIDAAIATGFALGVVDQFNSGVGGGGFIVIRLADGTIYTIDGRETAPAAATRDMYLRDGKFDPDMSKLGPLAVGVPGILAAYVKALELAGTRTLSELISPSVKVARKGFALDSYYLSRYNSAIDKFAEDPASAKIYLHKEGSHLKEGNVLIQQDLAATYQKIAHGGLDYFYRGEFAEKLAEYMAKHGGLITRVDMENYRIRMREPIMGTYHQYTVIGMAPPSSGGVHVIQILNMLETSGVLEGKSKWDWNSVYWTTQFMRKAFEDRVVHLGDSDFYPVPVERLISKSYADSCVRAIMNSEIATAKASVPVDIALNA
ncbi:MAG: gamma-glutamyltransferase, partial [Candidatus Marinimicrobia bacterium]|nr:gamma-glutamyltransferase [Candidatus Neomarinimicrobiota bacterium]